MREEAIKLKLDIFGERSPVKYPYHESIKKENGELFSGDCVTYEINGKEFPNIYGITLVSQKEGGTKTELWIKRALDKKYDFPDIIDEIIITSQLLWDKYEHRHFGTFKITLNRLVLDSDETQINSVDTVIGPLRYYVSGIVKVDVYTSGEVAIK
jgi:hypothetical protein